MYSKDIDYKYELYVCNECHDISMTTNELENIVILNVKGVDYRCIIWKMTRNDVINRLDNFKLDDIAHFKYELWDEWNTYWKSLKRAFEGTYFREICCGI